MIPNITDSNGRKQNMISTFLQELTQKGPSYEEDFSELFS